MQCDPQAPLKQVPHFLPVSPSLYWPQPQFMEEALYAPDRVRIDRRAPGSWGDGQIPVCQEERTWLLCPQVHCPLPRPKQFLFNISIPWLIFKHGSLLDKFFRGAFAVGLGGSRDGPGLLTRPPVFHQAPGLLPCLASDSDRVGPRFPG